jgi:hypothetical protein
VQPISLGDLFQCLLRYGIGLLEVKALTRLDSDWLRAIDAERELKKFIVDERFKGGGDGSEEKWYGIQP